MATITWTPPAGWVEETGTSIRFTAPCPCSEADGIQIGANTYAFVDAAGQAINARRGSFIEGAVVEALLDCESLTAYLSNPGGAPIINLGTFEGDIDDVNALPVNSVCWVTTSTVNNPYNGGYAVLETWGSQSAIRMQRMTTYTAATTLHRMLVNGTWTAWKWDSPPMVAGVEYLTSERYIGKDVYVRIINCGTSAASMTKTVTITGITNIVRANVRCGQSEGTAIINGSLSAANTFTYLVSATTNTLTINTYAGSGRTGQTVYATVYYTK